MNLQPPLLRLHPDPANAPLGLGEKAGSRLELHVGRGFDLDRCTSGRIAAHASSALLGREGAEAMDRDLATRLESRLDGLEDGVHITGGIALGNTSRRCNLLHEFRFIEISHVISIGFDDFEKKSPTPNVTGVGLCG